MPKVTEDLNIADTFVPFFISDMRTSEDFPYNIANFFLYGALGLF